MKVALCLSGHLRTFDKVFPAIKRAIIDSNDCDIFVATWNVMGFVNSHKHQTAQYLLPVDPDKVRQCYGSALKSLAVFDQAQFISSLSSNVGPGIPSMYFLIKQANDLRLKYEHETNVTYKAVIRSRPDLILENQLEISERLAIGSVICTPWVMPCSICDTFAVSASEPMNLYAMLFDYLDEYLAQDYEALADNPSGITPERILRRHLDRFQVAFSGIPFQTRLLRAEDQE